MKTELIPVIHMLDEDQVLINVDTCIENGIKKIFIINHEVSVQELLNCANKVKNNYKDLWVGVNMLGQTTEYSLSMDTGLDGLWCDASVKDSNVERNFKGTFFGGVAFKYQPQPKDLKLACDWAKITTDVATTSGSGTGKAANISKILEIRNLLGKHPMAIASGVSIQNINDYKGIVDYLLVASSITNSDEIIIKEKLKELVNY